MITAHRKVNLLALWPGSLAYPLHGEWVAVITPDEVCYTDLLQQFLNESSAETIAQFSAQKDLPAITKFIINNRKGK